jgi:hypothetical protein
MLDLTHSLLRLSVVYATYDYTVRYPSLALGLLASTLLGCSLSSATPSSSLIPAQLNQNSTTTVIPIAHAVRPLPFTGRLTQGDPDELPPSVAASLSANSPVTFVYREQLIHDEYHVPLAFSAFDPVTYVGAPLGDYGVTAFATLTISCGDTILGDYQARLMYQNPTICMPSRPIASSRTRRAGPCARSSTRSLRATPRALPRPLVKLTRRPSPLRSTEP